VQGSLAHTLVRNAVAGGGARAITLLVGLFMTPYVLHRLGEARFGILALTTVVTGAAGVLDFSLKSSFVKFLAELNALGDRAGHDQVVATSVAFYAIFGAVGLGLYASAADWIPELLRIPSALRGEAHEAFFVALGGFFLAGVLSVFPAVCDARQRLDLTNALGVVCLLGATALTIVFLELGAGLRGVVLAQFVGIASFHIGAIVLARALVGPLHLSVRSPSWSWFRRLFSFGLKLHISSTCGIVNRQLDKLLLGRWVGLSTVTSYEVGLRVAANAGSFQPFLAAALLPAASHLHAEGETAGLVELYERASRYLFLVGVPLFVFILVNSPDLVTAWLGRPDPMASAVLRLLAVGYMVNSLSNAMAFVCQGIGRPDIQARQSAVQLAANLVLSVLLFRLLGPLGPPLGTSLALILGAWFFAVKFHPVLGTSTLRLLRYAAAAPGVAAVAAATAGWGATAGLEATGRSEAALGLLLAAGVFAVVYLGGCWIMRVLGREELVVLRSVISGGQGGAKG
jgi:O-antigen/teichoic acid export membrane protein